MAAVGLLREMQQWHMLADVITYSATISACEKGQQWIAAMSLLREMQQWNMEANVITYSATICACEKGQQWITAVSLLREMQKWNLLLEGFYGVGTYKQRT